MKADPNFVDSSHMALNQTQLLHGRKLRGADRSKSSISIRNRDRKIREGSRSVHSGIVLV